MNQYEFTSERLGFRNWVDADIPKMAIIHQDAEVMKFFPSCLDFKQTADFIQRMQDQFIKSGYCYFAVERLDNQEFIGSIGLMYQDYEISFAPYVDIGWRLAKNEWNNGFATEGALRCLEYGFNTLNLQSIVSICPVVNRPSENVMKKIGMKKLKEFNHPLLVDNPDLQNCLLYSIHQEEFQPFLLK